jgi:stress-induced morphogen
MPVSRQFLHDALKAAFPDAEIVLADLAGDDDHWAVSVCAEAFRGKGRVAQHKMVYAALAGAVGAELHALQVTTSVPPDRRA